MSFLLSNIFIWISLILYILERYHFPQKKKISRALSPWNANILNVEPFRRVRRRQKLNDRLSLHLATVAISGFNTSSPRIAILRVSIVSNEIDTVESPTTISRVYFFAYKYNLMCRLCARVCSVVLLKLVVDTSIFRRYSEGWRICDRVPVIRPRELTKRRHPCPVSWRSICEYNDPKKSEDQCATELPW